MPSRNAARYTRGTPRSNRDHLDKLRLQGNHGFIRRSNGQLTRTDGDQFGCPHSTCHLWFGTEQAAQQHFHAVHPQAVRTVRVPKDWRPPWAAAPAG